MGHHLLGVSGPRAHFRGRRAAGPPLVLVAAVLGAVAALAVVGTVAISPWSPFRPASSGGHLSAATCSKIESSSNLSAGVYFLYYGNGNRTGLGSGLINQSPPGPSAYPPEASAVANVARGWQSVCTSASFYTLEQRWGPTNASWSALARNTSGIYEDVITITWEANPSQCSPNYGECLGTVTWTVNVASGAVAGPISTYDSPRPAI